MEQLKDEYKDHYVFYQLSDIAEFYGSLSITTMGFVSQGTTGFLNLDSPVFSSLRGTLCSIREILLNGRISDSYALLRKYYDSTIINVYASLYLRDHFNLDNVIVEPIENWKNGTKKIPGYQDISKYVEKSPILRPITDLLLRDEHYKNIRKRCNDHVHYNYYHNLLLNDNEIYFPNRIKSLNTFSADLTAVFVQHFAYIFYLNDHYMMSTDYIDCLDANMVPEEGLQNLVSPFIQRIFDKWIKPYRPDIAEEIKSNTSMKLE